MSDVDSIVLMALIALLSFGNSLVRIAKADHKMGVFGVVAE